MNAFYQILHKQNSESAELYNFNLTECKNDHCMSFYNCVYNYELAAVRNRFIKDLDENGYISYNCYSVTTFKNMLYLLIGVIEEPTIKRKFEYYKSTIHNFFINTDTKQMFIDAFCKAQRSYYILNRLVRNYKWRKSSFAIQTDIYLNPISENARNVITVLQNGKKYLFTIMDLKHIIETSLINSPYFFSEPLPSKNPYNNLPFQKSDLYNIYFFIKKSDYVMSSLFHQFFLSNFHLKKFRIQNEVLIRNSYIESYIKNSDENLLYKLSLRVFKESKFYRMISIHKDFPKDKMVSIMRPYIRLYLYKEYSLDISYRYKCSRELDIRLSQFVKFNNRFGQTVVISENNKRLVISHNDKHIPFEKTNYFDSYENTHLEIIDDINEIYVSDNDNDSDSETETETENVARSFTNNQTTDLTQDAIIFTDFVSDIRRRLSFRQE
uniref:Uncharacterized protein n=1 Tax=viral metagenome TaxID=1070528 RepID=A0A6C0DKH5_9ZZZZ